MLDNPEPVCDSVGLSGVLLKDDSRYGSVPLLDEQPQGRIRISNPLGLFEADIPLELEATSSFSWT